MIFLGRSNFDSFSCKIPTFYNYKVSFESPNITKMKSDSNISVFVSKIWTNYEAYLYSFFITILLFLTNFLLSLNDNSG